MAHQPTQVSLSTAIHCIHPLRSRCNFGHHCWWQVAAQTEIDRIAHFFPARHSDQTLASRYAQAGRKLHRLHAHRTEAPHRRVASYCQLYPRFQRLTHSRYWQQLTGVVVFYSYQKYSRFAGLLLLTDLGRVASIAFCRAGNVKNCLQPGVRERAGRSGPDGTHAAPA